MGKVPQRNNPLRGNKTVFEMGYTDIEINSHGIIQMTQMTS